MSDAQKRIVDSITALLEPVGHRNGSVGSGLDREIGEGFIIQLISGIWYGMYKEPEKIRQAVIDAFNADPFALYDAL